ncbi:PTS sugar transporter subunit IIA [Olsenella intestinalis]|uniref:PTS sugar transporter subunit IIA n=1 Tax=Olsenella intestinalis TaxID=2930083 RepID=UPI00200EBC39
MFDDRFVASTLERESVADTSMNEVFAIPHTTTPIASRTAVSVAILRHPIKWSE